MSYSNIKVHKLMLKDELRTQAFLEAINKLVKKSDSVIDFGSGTGILSFFASKAGAEKVHAIEQTDIINAAMKIAEMNEINNIVFHHGNESKIQLNNKVDLIVSEWMGHFAFRECMFEPLLQLRDRYLKKEGIMIPSKISLHIGMVTDETIFEDIAFFNKERYGMDFTFLNEWMFNQTYAKHLRADQVNNDSIMITEIDMQTVDKIPELKCIFKSKKHVKVYGLCGWFDAELTEGIDIKTGPFSEKTHWRQIVFPFKKPITLDAGEEMKINIQPIKKANSDRRFWRWVIETKTQKLDMNDFLIQAFIKNKL